MATTKKKPPTALQLFRQNRKIESLADRLREEKSKLSDMVGETHYLTEKINVEGTIYEVATVRGAGNWSWDNRIQVTELGTAEEFAKLAS
jgi:hypothetical protein